MLEAALNTSKHCVSTVIAALFCIISYSLKKMCLYLGYQYYQSIRLYDSRGDKKREEVEPAFEILAVHSTIMIKLSSE